MEVSALSCQLNLFRARHACNGWRPAEWQTNHHDLHTHLVSSGTKGSAMARTTSPLLSIAVARLVAPRAVASAFSRECSSPSASVTAPSAAGSPRSTPPGTSTLTVLEGGSRRGRDGTWAGAEAGREGGREGGGEGGGENSTAVENVHAGSCVGLHGTGTYVEVVVTKGDVGNCVG